MAPQDAPATEEDLHPHARGPEVLFPSIPSAIKREQGPSQILKITFTHFRPKHFWVKNLKPY